ncbi:MAG TPA: hypothetical protein VH247_03985 [Thermoleophilaceae bacterium]|jgi:hypothetical protein|nr:hypothetical protein [Thermoleophilaceae bacterium]
MRISLLALIALALLAAAPAYAANDMSTSTYAVIGDTPYSTFQIQHFPADIAEINADPDVSRVIHLGDIKSGSTRCDTADADPNTGDFTQIRSDFDLFADPLVYTPGDNEWTDCHRANNGGYTPTERLATLRSIFFSNPSGDFQDGYPENVTWNQSRVQFGVLNIPGSNNDWLPWFGQPRTQTQIDEVTNRTQADLDWLDHIFSQAKASKAKAILIGIQADMWDPALGAAPAQSDHFTPIVQALARLSRKWERPVLLMNGDSHVFGADHPLDDPSTAQNQVYGLTDPVPNLERITVNGSTTPCHQWLKLTIDPKSDAIFSWAEEPFANQDTANGQGCSW